MTGSAVVGGAVVGGAVIAGIGIAYPPGVGQQELWDGFFAAHFAGVQRTLARRLFANSGVRRRQAVVSPLAEDVTRWSTEARMARYLVEAMPLGKAAVGDALAEAGVAAADVGFFAVCSCTGYATPGLDILLARDLGFSPDAQRLFIGHMGCYAALPGLGVVADRVRASGRPGLLLCCELTSLHLQPPTANVGEIVSHALFADACAAVVVLPSGGVAGDGVAGDGVAGGGVAGHSEPGGAVSGSGSGVRALMITDIVSVTDTATSDYMTWEVTDLGFKMGLSEQVPNVLADHVGPLVNGLLSRYGLVIQDVDGWAVHPGGPRILEVIERELGLGASALEASRNILAEHGNCSSPTVLMVLDALRRAPRPPQRTMMLAFGPGLTLYAALLSAGRA